MSTADKTDAETEGSREQKSTVDNHMKKALTLHDDDEGGQEVGEGRSELSSLGENVADSQVYTTTSLSVIPKENRKKTHPLVS